MPEESETRVPDIILDKVSELLTIALVLEAVPDTSRAVLGEAVPTPTLPLPSI